MNSRWITALRSTGLASVLVMTLSAVGAAQRPATAGAPATHPQPSAKAAPQATQHPDKPLNASGAEGKNFSGVAGQLNVTPEALGAAYQAALVANPKLTRGQFISANMVAKNLSDKNAAITTQAILDGYVSGKSMGQTLQGLGLSPDEAASAEAEGNRQAWGQSEDKKPKP